jgi:hypothetical protein
MANDDRSLAIRFLINFVVEALGTRSSQRSRMANASLVATACFVAIGCSGAAATDHASVSELTREVDSLRKVVAVIEVQRTRERVLDELKSAVYLTPGDDGYDILQTQFGAVTVSLRDVQPYANGSRVALRFGNATAATLTGRRSTAPNTTET